MPILKYKNFEVNVANAGVVPSFQKHRELSALVTYLEYYVTPPCTVSDLQEFLNIFTSRDVRDEGGEIIFSEVAERVIEKHGPRFFSFVLHRDHYELKNVITHLKSSPYADICCAIMLSFLTDCIAGHRPGTPPGIAAAAGFPALGVGAPPLLIPNVSAFLQADPAFTTIGARIDDPAFRDRVILAPIHAAQVATFLNEFVNDVKRRPAWGSYARYFSKNSARGIPGHAVLLFTALGEENFYYVIIKSNTQVSTDVGRHSLFHSGSFKIVKVYGLLLRVECPPNQAIHCDLFPIVTLTSITHKVRVSAALPNASIPYGHHDFARKSTDLRTILTHPNYAENFVDWDGCIDFEDPNLPGTHRLICYQKSAGQTPCQKTGSNLVSWSSEERINGIVTLLDSIKDILARRFWPVDIKFENMCVQVILGKLPRLNVIDFLNLGGSTYSLFKDKVSNAHDNPYIRNVTLHDFGALLHRLNYRHLPHLCPYHFDPCTPPSDDSFKRLLFELLFELAYNIFFIWNIALAQISNTYSFGSYKLALPPRAHMAADLRKYTLGRFLTRYIYDQDFSQNTDVIMGNFLVLIRDKVFPISAPVDVNGPVTDILTNAWIEDFVRLIVGFRDTPSPFTPLNILHTQMI